MSGGREVASSSLVIPTGGLVDKIHCQPAFYSSIAQIFTFYATDRRESDKEPGISPFGKILKSDKIGQF